MEFSGSTKSLDTCTATLLVCCHWHRLFPEGMEVKEEAKRKENQFQEFRVLSSEVLPGYFDWAYYEIRQITEHAESE